MDPSKYTGVIQVLVSPMLNPRLVNPCCRACTFTHNLSLISDDLRNNSKRFNDPMVWIIGKALANICERKLYLR